MQRRSSVTAPMSGALLTVLMLLAGMMGCAHGLDDGRQAMEMGDYERAESIAAEQLEQQPDSPWAHQLMAESLVARGDYRDALSFAEAADESDAFPARAPAVLGEIHHQLNNPLDAVDALHRARQTDESVVDDDLFVAALEKALPYAATRGFHETRWNVANWLKQTDPDHPAVAPKEFAVIRRAYAIALRRDGEYTEAVDLLETALNDDPEHLRGEALDLGEIYARLEMNADARRAWRHYLDDDVDDREFIQRHLDVARLASRHNMTGVAVDTLEPLPDRIDDPIRRGEIILELTRHQFRAGHTTDARRSAYRYIDEMTAGADDGRASPRPYLQVAELADELNQTRLKINILQRALDDAEPSRTVVGKLADIYAHRAQLVRAEEILEQFIDRYDSTYQAVMFAGRWARERNNYALARDYFQRATDYDDTDPDAWYALAESLGQLGNFEPMDGAVEAYLTRRDHSDDALSEAGQLLAEFERFEAAEHHLRRLHNRAPDRRRPTRQLADLYHQWSRPAQAAEVWERWIAARGDDPTDIAAVAGLLHRTDDLQRAARLYHRAADAGDINARLSAADVHLQREDFPAMSAALQRYVDDHPDRTEALDAAADRYDDAGMANRHVDILMELVDRQPDQWRFHHRLAAVLIEENRTDEAFQRLHRFVDNADDPAAALQLISARLTDGDQGPRLLNFYRRWYDDPDVHPTILRLIGDAYHAVYDHPDTAPGPARHARSRARSYYLDYLDEADDTDANWTDLAEDWHDREMWGPAVRAWERGADRRDRSSLHSHEYAEALLQLGEQQRATEVLERYFQSERSSTAVAGEIAQLLIDFSMYDDAESYASHLLLGSSGARSSHGFQLLAEINAQREDYDQLDSLAANYLERTGHTNRARRTVASTLENLGQWESAAHHLGQLAPSAVHQFAIQAGFHHYRHGDGERAFRTFEESAHNAGNPERAWLTAARFLHDRGDLDGADAAFDRALQLGPDDLDVRTTHGAFAILRGDTDTGWRDYRIARESTSTFETSQRRQFFDAFAAIGDFVAARTVADDMQQDGKSLPVTMREALGDWKLAHPDRDTRLEGLEHARATSWGSFDTVHTLNAAGRHDLILEKIDTEFSDGDPTTAAALLLHQSGTLDRLVGWDRKRQWLEDVVNPLRRDGRLVGAVGDRRIAAGQFDDGLPYLRAAGGDDAVYLSQYGHVSLLQGDTEEAFWAFEAKLARGDAGDDTLSSILFRFETAGEHDQARRFLNRIAADPAFVDIALPYKAHYDLEHHADPNRILDNIFEIAAAMHELPSHEFHRDERGRRSPGLSRHSIVDSAVIDALAAVASLGHTGPVRRALNDAPVYELDRHLELLALRLAVADGDLDDAQRRAIELVDGADDHAQRQNARLQLAEEFIAHGADQLAEAMIDDALDEQTHSDNHRAFVLKLGLELIGGTDDLSPLIDGYLESVSNRHDARVTIFEALYRMGRDDEALALARDGVRIRPDTEMIRRMANAAFAAGDIDALTESVDRLFAVADDPVGEIENALMAKFPGAEEQLVLPIIERVRQARPHDLAWTVEHARVLFDAGRTDEGRRVITELLRARDYNRQAVADVVDGLSDHYLDIEILRVIGPEISGEQLSAKTAVAVAESALALDARGDADQWIDRLEALGDQPAMWLMELGHRLVSRQLFDPLDTVVARLREHDDIGPYAELLAGIHKLADGDTAGGIEHLRAANAGGVDVHRTHYNGIRAALHGGQTETAAELMVELMELPARDDDIASLPMRLMVSAALEMPDGPATLRTVLEEHRPRILDGAGATWKAFDGQLAAVLEHTGDPQGAYGFYRDRLWQARFTDDAPVPTYLNNLAYTYATTNHDIDAGLDKIRRAIALDDRRSPSFLDTLGWLKYRDDDLPGADTEIRRALRSYDGQIANLAEMLDHLRDISELRGVYDRAATVDAHRQRLPLPGLER